VRVWGRPGRRWTGKDQPCKRYPSCVGCVGRLLAVRLAGHTAVPCNRQCPQCPQLRAFVCYIRSSRARVHRNLCTARSSSCPRVRRPQRNVCAASPTSSPTALPLALLSLSCSTSAHVSAVPRSIRVAVRGVNHALELVRGAYSVRLLQRSTRALSPPMRLGKLVLQGLRHLRCVGSQAFTPLS
jgi:hypothetical protein